jgi:branched-chain amino acid transport system substrate-binding protein
VYVLAQAIEEAGSTEGAAVAEAMRTLEYDLLTGSLDWGDVESGHETVKELFIIGLEGGEPSLVTRFIPEAVPNPFAE